MLLEKKLAYINDDGKIIHQCDNYATFDKVNANFFFSLHSADGFS